MEIDFSKVDPKEFFKPDPLLPGLDVCEKGRDGASVMEFDLTKGNGSVVVFTTGDITVKGVAILNTGQIFKMVDGKLVEDDGSGETALD